MTYSIQLDVSHEVSIDEVNEFAKSHGCVATLLEEFGPAGGNPLYEFTSQKYDYLLELASSFLQDSAYAESMIEEV